jgi:hypothetical protein
VQEERSLSRYWGGGGARKGFEMGTSRTNDVRRMASSNLVQRIRYIIVKG